MILNTCRLCLVACSSDMQYLTEGCDLITTLALCLSHHVQITDDLPKKVCLACFNKVKDIQLFRERIIQNEYILLQRVRDPISFTKIPEVKLESEDQVILNDVKQETIRIHKVIKNAYCKTELEDINDSCNETPDLYDDKDKNNVLCDNKSQLQLNLKTLDISNNDINNMLNINSLHVTEENMCLTCFDKFPSRLELLDHYEHIEKQKYNKSKIENTNNLKYKVIHMNGKTVFKCEKCSKESRTKELIKRHFLTHRDRPFLCKLCGRTYRSAIEIMNHGKVHGVQVFACSFKCGYSSVHKHVIKDHERRHRNEFKYTCETCGKQFQVKTWYLQHQNIHTGIKPYVCKICSMAFHLDRYLTQHRNTVHPQVTTQIRYLCVHCNMPFGSKHSLGLHLKDHNIDASTIECLCDECGKVLKNARQLKCHKRIHINPKPYACGTCNKVFARKSHLMVHERIHTDVRYPCDKCSKRFTQRSSLKRHLIRCRETVQSRRQKRL